MDTMLIQLNDQKAAALIHELEELNLIKVLEENIFTEKPKLSEKYKNIISKEEGEDLHKHIQQIRNEWSNT